NLANLANLPNQENLANRANLANLEIGDPRGSPIVAYLLPLWNFELCQVRDDVLPRGAGAHLLVDECDLAGRIEVERPASPELPLGRRVGREDAVGHRDFLVGIGEQREIGVLFFRERLVVVESVDADHEVRRVVLANESPALTERVAFRGSTSGERLREPRED